VRAGRPVNLKKMGGGGGGYLRESLVLSHFHSCFGGAAGWSCAVVRGGEGGLRGVVCTVVSGRGATGVYFLWDERRIRTNAK
jgi:hypothetical protein